MAPHPREVQPYTDRLRFAHLLSPMNLVDKFLQIVDSNPAAPACLFNNQVISRGMLHQWVCRIAIDLHAKGIGAGAVVGVSMDHSPTHLAALLALARLGAVSLPVHPTTARAAQRRLMQHYGASQLLCEKTPSPMTGIELIELAKLEMDGGSGLKLDFIDYWPAPSAPARIGLTSGTTGLPGAILYTHAYWLDRIDAYMSIDHCDAQSRLMPSDLHLTLGNYSALGALFAGGLVVFHALQNFQSFVSAINLNGVTHASMPPAMIKNLAAQLPYEGIAFPTIRLLRLIGAGVTRQLVQLVSSKITPNVYLPYGMSEIGPISFATPEMLLSHPDYAGQVRPGVELQAVDPDGQVLPAGESGELRVKVSGMPQRYHLNDERTAQQFVNGWFMTRDVGFITADGMVRIEGRMDDKINLGGLKFYPERVEEILNAHPEVKDAAVFVVEGQDQNKVLMAVVVPKHPPPFALRLVDYCKDKKLGNMAPQRFVLVREIPRNPTGKIMRSALADLIIRKPDDRLH